VASKSRRSARRRTGPPGPGGRYTPPKDQADYARLPTSKLARLLLELFRQGDALPGEPDADGTVRFSWSADALGTGSVAVPAGDDQLLELIGAARSDSHLWVELAALLTVLLQVDGVAGAFRPDQVLELTLSAPTHPPPTLQSLNAGRSELGKPAKPDRHHPERHRPHVRALLRLLAEADWQITLSHNDADLVGWVDGPLVDLADPNADGAPQTATLVAGVHQALGVFTTLVPRRAYRLRDRKHSNPEGNLPSRACRARIRLAGAMAQRWRAHTGRRVSMQEIIETFAGIDSGRFGRRGRLVSLLQHGLDELADHYQAGGAGLAAVPPLERLQRPLLRLLVSLVMPPVTGSDAPDQRGQLTRAGP
jgi:hypothetical protein